LVCKATYKLDCKQRISIGLQSDGH
jgi:hypothetical protein